MLMCAMLSGPSDARAECEPEVTCETNSDQDVIELRDGTAICGTIVHGDEGHSLTIVSRSDTRTLEWDEIACTGTRPRRSRATLSPQYRHREPREVEPWSGIFLEWDLRAFGIGLFKHYERAAQSAWSYGLGGGVLVGASLRFQSEPNPASGLSFYTLQLGVEGSVGYDAWHQVSEGSASAIQQNLSLVLGGRIALGTTGPSADGRHWSGVMIGLAWLPTYVDFYGKQISSAATINPAGVRATVDIGGANGPGRGHSPLLRLALAYLPNVTRLPVAYVVSAGVVFF